jgi:hypothetical protein
MKEDAYFWILFSGFVALIVWSFWATDHYDNITTVGGRVILTIAILVVGVLIRKWVKGGMRF